MSMNFRKIKEAFAQILLSFSEISTDKGILAWDAEGDLKEGDEVYSVKEDGSREKAEDGDYTAEDGKVISVVEGKVASIKDPEAEIAPAAEEPKAEEAMEDEVIVEEKPIEEGPKPEDEIIKKLEDLLKKLAELEERLAKLENAPAAEPVAEEFKKISEIRPSADEHKNFLKEMAKSCRK